jgi:C4-dicarboxylate-specific signal transduction histidine kinase
MEYRRRRHDGVYRWFQTSVQPLKNQQGEVIRWYGVLTDVDDLRRAEESLRLTQEKLSHAMQIGALSEFAASVVHEISQPLTAIVADGEACRVWLSLNSPNIADSRAAIARIVRHGEEVRKIIGTLRNLFRRAPAEKVPVNLKQVVNEVITLARNRAHNQQVVIDSQIPVDLPAVMADRIQLQQVLMNLLLNAMSKPGSETSVALIRMSECQNETRRRILAAFNTVEGVNMSIFLIHLSTYYKSRPTI